MASRPTTEATGEICGRVYIILITPHKQTSRPRREGRRWSGVSPRRACAFAAGTPLQQGKLKRSVPLKIFIRHSHAILQGGLGMPSERMQARYIHQLARCAVGLGAVEFDVPLIADDISHGFGQLPNCEVFTPVAASSLPSRVLKVSSGRFMR